MEEKDNSDDNMGPVSKDKEETPVTPKETEENKGHEQIKEDLETNDDEVIDFSGMKKKATDFFKDLKARKGKIKSDIKDDEEDSEEQIQFDFKKAVLFCKNNSKWLIPLFFILIAIGTSTYFRMMPSELPITDNWAQNNVYSFYQQRISSEVNQQYPNLPQQNRDALIQSQFTDFLEHNSDQINNDVNQLSQQFKDRLQDENGDTYLLAIDPYLWYSQARNVINHGHLGDVIEDGVSKFSLRGGRFGKIATVQLNPYVGAYLFKFLSVFTNISLMRTMWLLPVIIIGISLIPAFFIGRKISGNVGGFFAAMFLGINGALLGRTPGGFSDTDPYNILFPVIIAWLFLESFLTESNRKRIIYGSLAGFSVGLYASAWGGWSAIFLFVLSSLILVTIAHIIKSFIKEKYKFTKDLFTSKYVIHKIKLLVIFIISSGIFVTVFQDFRRFSLSFIRPIQFIAIKDVGVKSIWPNVFTTVAEFNTISFSSIISQMGGDLLFWIGLMGVVFMFFNRKKPNPKNIGYLFVSALYYAILISFKESLNDPVTFILIMSVPLVLGLLKIIYYKENVNLINPVLLAIWLFGTAFAFSKGVRFAILMVPPFTICLGIALGYTYEWISKWLTKGINLDYRISKVVIFAVLGLLLITPLSSAERISVNEVPSMNDAWYNTLTKIKQDSTQAIITSWWDFGHWFVAVAERKVTFDGGGQGRSIHWVGKSLLSNNEKESVGILRMLNCVHEQAPDKLDEFTKDTLKSTQILNEVIPISNKLNAQQKYEELGLTKEQAATMLEYTHCQDILPSYYITSEDMIGKAGVWGHFGSWDFRKAKMYQNTIKPSRNKAVSYLTKEFNITEKEADSIHNEIQTTVADRWISPWPGYLSGINSCEKLSDRELRCVGSAGNQNIAFRVDLQEHIVVTEGNQEVVPNSLVYVTKTGIEKKELEGKKLGISLVLIPNGENYNFMITDPLQAASLFTKLFFLDGHGLECFSKFDDVRSFNGQRIVTWKVDYECQQENNVFFNEPIIASETVA